MHDAIEQFRAAIHNAGLHPPEVIEPDGKLRRFASNGKRGDDAGWYVLHDDGLPAGAFGDWRSGLSETWRADIGRTLSPQEEVAHRARVDAMRRAREAEDARRKAEAAGKAQAIWSTASPAGAHSYLTEKGVKAHGLRLHDGALVIPMRDSTELHSLQFIGPDGDKRFLTGGRVSGCYFSIGQPEGTLCIVEGYATGASVHECTGHAVAVAFNAGNLEEVTKAMRGKFPDARIVVAGDNDQTGQNKAAAAARAVGGFVAIPETPGKDWNDVHQEQGVEAVKAGIEAAQPITDHDPASNTVRLIRGAELKPEPIRWTWERWLARGKLHIIAGAPGTGKTTLALALAATQTCGGRWPDGTRTQTGNVLIWSGEDDIRDTLLPRLLAMGADPERVYFVGDTVADGKARPFDPSRDMETLAAEANRIGEVRLLIVDPVVNAVSGDSHKNTEVRRALQPLVDLIQRLDAVGLGVSHFSKNTAGRDPVERVTGSIAFGALPRVVFGTAKTEEGGRVFVRAKSNIGPDGGGFEYQLEQATVPGHALEASRVLWGAALEGQARELLATAEAVDEEHGLRDEIADWLQDLLYPGRMKSQEVQSKAKQSGFAWRTVQRTAKETGVVMKREGFGPDTVTYWSLAPVAPSNTSRASVEKLARVDTFGATDEIGRGSPEVSALQIEVEI